MALCGELLHYVDDDTDVHKGDLASGRAMVSERTVECIKCLRRQADRASDYVLVPAGVVAQLAAHAPELWVSVSAQLDISVINRVNSYLE